MLSLPIVLSLLLLATLIFIVHPISLACWYAIGGRILKLRNCSYQKIASLLELGSYIMRKTASKLYYYMKYSCQYTEW